MAQLNAEDQRMLAEIRAREAQRWPYWQLLIASALFGAAFGMASGLVRGVLQRCFA